MAKFEIRRHSPSNYASRKYAGTAVRGTGFGPHATDVESCDLTAVGGTFIGFIARAITAAGPTLADHVYMHGHEADNAIELPYKSGDEVSLCKADEIEVEGELGNAGLLTTSGTGAISSGQAIGTKLGFSATGKLRVAQANDQYYYHVTATLVPEDAGNVRIVAEHIEGLI